MEILLKNISPEMGHFQVIIIHGTTAPSGPRPFYCRGFAITLRDTTRLDE
jgi:hypothetical protein